MPLFWLGIALIAGIYLSAYSTWQISVWTLLALLGLLIAMLELLQIPKSRHPLRSRKLFALPCGLLLSAFALGGWRFQSRLPEFSVEDLAWFQPLEQVVLTGTVSSFPQRSASASTAIVQAELIQVYGQTYPVSGLVDLRLPAGFHLAYGDRLRLSGSLENAFPKDRKFFESHSARKGVFSRMAYPQIEWFSAGQGNPILEMLYNLRLRAQEVIYSQTPFPESALLEGILLGIEWNIPPILRQAYRGSGLIHIIAISGFIIALISNLVVRLFRRVLPLAWAAILSLGAIIFYTLLVGAEAAVVRAAIMGCLAIPAHYVGRRVFGLHALLVAASLMLLLNPFLLWDISFQLSFLATMGLMLLVDPLSDWVHGQVERRFSEASAERLMPILVLVISTLSAQFAVSPVLLALDPHLPVFSLIANLIILPLQPIVMGLGGLSVLVELVMPAGGRLLGWLVWPFIALGNQTALRFSLNPLTRLRLPAASVWISAVLVAVCMVMTCVVQLRGISQGRPPVNQ